MSETRDTYLDELLKRQLNRPTVICPKCKTPVYDLDKTSGVCGDCDIRRIQEDSLRRAKESTAKFEQQHTKQTRKLSEELETEEILRVDQQGGSD